MGFHILSSKDNAKQTLKTYLELSANEMSVNSEQTKQKVVFLTVYG